MKYFFNFLTLCLFALQTLLSEENDSSRYNIFADLQGTPSAIVNGTVNVITGDYIDSDVDLIIPGAEPLTAERSYISSNNTMDTLCYGWSLNHFGLLQLSGEKNFNHKSFTRKNSSIGDDSTFYGSHGERIHYSCTNRKVKGHRFRYKLDKTLLNEGFTNTGRGSLGATTNIKNDVVVCWPTSSTAMIDKCSGEHLEFEKLLGKDSLRYYLTRIRKPNKLTLNYDWYKKRYVRKVSLTNSSGEVINSLTYEYPDKKTMAKKPQFSVIASNGQKIKYEYKKHAENGLESWLLSKVKRDGLPDVSYAYHTVEINYEKYGTHLTEKRFPENRFLKTGYYKYKKNNVGGSNVNIEKWYDLKLNRVSLQMAPVGTDAKPIVTHRFFYEIKNEGRKGKTIVLDALSNRTEYLYKKRRMTEIIRFMGGISTYSKEKFFWGDPDTPNEGNLISRTLKMPDDAPILCRHYTYDDNGNVTNERLYGNLSGNNTTPLIISLKGIPQENGCEFYEKSYQYHPAPTNLLYQENDGKKVDVYQYHPQTNLVLSKHVTVDRKIKERNFYFYDQNGVLIKEILDDGNTIGESDLTGVTERKIKVIVPTVTPHIGLAGKIELRYLDLGTGVEKLERRIVNEYSLRGDLIQQDHYDSDGTHVSTEYWEHNSMGNVTKHIDVLGQETIMNYDLNGNKIYEKKSLSDSYHEYKYDFSNRLICKKTICNNGTIFSIHNKYNYLGNKVSEIDIYGNETLYSYDGQERLIKMTFPEIISPDGSSSRPIIAYEYDIMGSLIKKCDGNGAVTKQTMNIRGQPTKIDYPDGSQELFCYNMDGTLREKVEKNGLLSKITYDYKQRPIEKQVYSAAGEYLYGTYSEYNAFNLIKEIDAAGGVTEYFYNGNGNVIRKVQNDRETTYDYDTLGRLTKTVETIDAKSSITFIKKYDLLNRVIEESTEDCLGHVQDKTCYQYDFDGNKTDIIKFNHAGISSTYQEYNALGEVIRQVDAEGKTTFTNHRYDYINEDGQHVGYRETIDPLGNVQVVIKNVRGQDCIFERKSPFGETTQKYQLYYDAEGRMIQRVETVFSGENQKDAIITKWKYNSNGRVIENVEAYGTPEQQVSTIYYNKAGEKERHIKPDGNELLYEYDSLGRLQRYSSAKGDIDYRYSYDILNKPVKIHDVISGCETVKEYDNNGNLARESLANGLEIGYTYDRIGRKTSVILHDGTSFEYEYDGLNLHKVVRKGVDKTSLYAHEYLDHDQSGHVLSAALIGKAGCVNYDYDIMNRTRSVESVHWSEIIAGFDDAGNLVGRSFSDAVGVSDDSYAYDDLYQLKRERGSFSHDYDNDSVYNRRSKDGNNYTVNVLNQICSDGVTNYAYDRNGNMISKEDSHDRWDYLYDSLERLVEAESKSVKVAYRYDETNRCLSKEVYAKGDETPISRVLFLYQDKHDIGTVGDDGNIIHLRLLGQGLGAEIGAAVANEIEGKVYAPIHDHNGHVVTLVDAETGNVFESYRYSAFGEESIYDSESSLCETSINPWHFSSKRCEKELGLINFGQRFYDPSLGRWVTPDPIGHDDGPNLYAYVRNSPLTSFDLWGEYTEQAESRCANRGNIIKRIYNHHVFSGYDSCYEERCGGPYSGSYDLQSEEHGSRPNVRNRYIMFINGILNSYRDSLESAFYISDFAKGLNVSYIYNASHGAIADLWESIRGLYFHQMTEPAKLLHKQWDEFFKNDTTGEKLLQNCHSQGAIHVRNALENYPEEYRKRIIVVAVAPAAYISKDLCYSVDHYVSTRDFVPLFDIFGRIRCRDTVHVLDAHPDAALVDHAYKSPTYQKVIKERTKRYIKHGY